MSRRWIVLTYMVGLLPLALLLRLDNRFAVDWTNHLWMISYVGEYFRRHWTFPITLNTDELIGLPYPVFYGYLFFPAVGLLSVLTGGNLALRIVCFLVLVLQLTQVRKTFEVLTENRFAAFAVAILTTFATYPLTNLYNRAAITEFVATSLLLSTTMICLRISHVGSTRDRRILLARAGLLFAFAAGTHPITAFLGGIAIVCVLGVTFIRLRMRIPFVKELIVVGALVALVLLPWIYALAKYGSRIYLSENVTELTVFKNSLDAFTTRFSPIPWDRRIGTQELIAYGTPYLDAQMNFPLFVLAAFLTIYALRTARRRSLVELFAGLTGLVVFAFVSFVSITPGFWAFIPLKVQFFQLAYRLVTYIDLALVLSVAFLGAAVAASKNRFRTTPVMACLFACLTLASVCLAIKLKHAAAVENIGILPGAELSRANRPALGTLPSTFYGDLAYASRRDSAGMIAEGEPVSFSINRTDDFGDVYPASPPDGKGPFRTNVQIFPWNEILVHGSEVPRQNLYFDERLRTVVTLPTTADRLEYRLHDDGIWRWLRTLAFWIAALSGIVALVLRESPIPITTDIPNEVGADDHISWRNVLAEIAHRRSVAFNTVAIAFIGTFLCIAFGPYLRSMVFGPEFVRGFASVNATPNTPLRLSFVYRLGETLADWHNPGQWRGLELLTVWLVCTLIYAFVLTVMPGRRAAAAAAAIYFASVPTVFAPIFEIAGFPYLAVAFTIASVLSFVKGYRCHGLECVLWTAVAWLSFGVAITGTTTALVVPLYLTFVAAILLRVESAVSTRRMRREAIRLAPFYFLAAVYCVLHRWSAVDSLAVVRNAVTYPLWIARIPYSAPLYSNWRNNIIGVGLAAGVGVTVVWLWSSRKESRAFLSIAAGWMVMFLVIPVYNGTSFQDANIALVGYAMLTGIAVDTLLRPRNQLTRAGLALVLGIAAVAVGRSDALRCAAALTNAEHRIDSNALAAPPVPFGKVAGPALIYIENTSNLPASALADGSLFRLVYLDPDIRQEVVPGMEATSSAARLMWIRRQPAFYFRYDRQYRWIDATSDFRRFISQHEPIASKPEIKALGPASTRVGVTFNPQPGGISAINVLGEWFDPQSTVVMGGHALATTFGSSTWITAVVPKSLYSEPGQIPVYVKNPGGSVSKTVTFAVGP